MTEDDTFQVLKRMPFLELWDKMRDIGIPGWDNFQSIEKFDEFIRPYGWTYHTFQDEHKKLFEKRDNAN